MEKKKLTQEEIDENDHIINSTLGDLAHEGLVDEDNFLRNLLTYYVYGRISEVEYDKILKERIGIK